jgi:hypothetical protein
MGFYFFNSGIRSEDEKILNNLFTDMQAKFPRDVIAEAKRKAKELEVVGTEGLSTTEQGNVSLDT